MASTALHLATPRRSSVYDDVRALVISSTLAINARIRIDDVAKRVSAGATPVREALFQLSAEGLVTARHQQGFWQPGIDRAELHHLIETRSVLEQMLLKEASAAWNDHHEQELMILFHRFSKLKALSPHGSYEHNRAWLEGHRSFHLALVAGSRNGWALRMVEMLNANADRYRSYILGAWLEATGSADLIDEIHAINTFDAHRELYELAMARKFDALAGALIEHNTEALALLDKALERLMRIQSG
ncbi:GntR family transcriptional regulator [Labrys neptuniae]